MATTIVPQIEDMCPHRHDEGFTIRVDGKLYATGMSEDEANTAARALCDMDAGTVLVSWRERRCSACIGGWVSF